MASRRSFLRLGLGSVALAALPARAQEEEHAMKDAPAYYLAARALGVSTERSPELSLAQQNLAEAIGRDVVCLCGTCPKRLVTDCDCSWAQKNLVGIKSAVGAGKSRAEILAAYRSVYGEKVLAMLPDEGVNRLAWALPVGGALGGLVLAGFVGRRYLQRKREAEAAPSAAAPAAVDASAAAELQRELEDLDG